MENIQTPSISKEPVVQKGFEGIQLPSVVQGSVALFATFILSSCGHSFTHKGSDGSTNTFSIPSTKDVQKVFKPKPNLVHEGPKVGPATHPKKGEEIDPKDQASHPDFFTHYGKHPHWWKPHTHPGPYGADNIIDVCDGAGGTTRKYNPYPTYNTLPIGSDFGGRLNNNVAPQAPKVAAPQLNSGTYTVQPGDTLGAIADRFGLPHGRLGALNPQITNWDKIYYGQQIRTK